MFVIVAPTIDFYLWFMRRYSDSIVCWFITALFMVFVVSCRPLFPDMLVFLLPVLIGVICFVWEGKKFLELKKEK